jgi:rod shape-determining protein MreD
MRLLGPVLRLVALVAAAVLGAVARARGWETMPDLVLVVVAASALTHGARTGAALGLLGGWVLDLLPPGGAHLGLTAVTYAVVGGLVGAVRREGPVAGVWVALVVGAAAAGLEVVRLVMALAVSAPVDVTAALVRVVVTGTIGALVVPVVLRLEHGAARRRFS